MCWWAALALRPVAFFSGCFGNVVTRGLRFKCSKSASCDEFNQRKKGLGESDDTRYQFYRFASFRTLFFLSFFFFLFSIPFIIFALLFSLPLINSRNSDPGSHGKLFSPLLTMVLALHSYPEKISALSSLVDLRRTVLTHARRSQQL